MIRLQQHRDRSFGYVDKPELTNDVNDIQGDGIVDWARGIKDKFTKKVLETRPKILNDLLKREGDKTITKIEVCRNPISGVFEKTLNVLTFGKLKREMKKKGYDRLYHLYLVIYLENGSVYSLEKNQRVNVIKGKTKGECMGPMNYGKETLTSFINDAEKRNIPGFYRYNAFKDNCQKWVYDLLNSNGVSNFNDFILQDVDKLAGKYVKTLARKITDVAGVFDFAFRGGANESKIPDDAVIEF